jgi:hypothetical protein
VLSICIAEVHRPARGSWAAAVGGQFCDSYDNAIADTVIKLYKTELIRRLGWWRILVALEMTTLEWVDWFNNRRLLQPLGHISPAEAQTKFFQRPIPACLSRVPSARPPPPDGRDGRRGAPT